MRSRVASPWVLALTCLTWLGLGAACLGRNENLRLRTAADAGDPATGADFDQTGGDVPGDPVAGDASSGDPLSGDPAPGDTAPASVFTEVVLPLGGFVPGVDVLPDNPTTLYAVAGWNRVFRSTDGAATWQERTPVTGDIQWMVVTPTTPGLVFLATDRDVLVSSDAGLTWNATGLNEDTWALWWLPNGDLLAGTDQGIRRRVGTSWQTETTPLEGYEVTTIGADPTGQLIVAGSFGNGMARTQNGGTSWVPANNGLGTLLINALVVSPARPTQIFAFANTQPPGTVRSNDSGASWTSVWTYHGGCLAVAPDDPDFVLAYHWNRLIESYNAGTSWSSTDRRTPNMNAAPIGTVLFDPQDSSIVYVAGGRGLFQSVGAGWAWTEVDVGLRAWVIPAIAVSSTPGTLYLATTAGVVRSTNNGATWSVRPTAEAIDEYVSISELYDVAVDPGSPNAVLAAGQNMNGSLDGGDTFNFVFRSGAADQYEVRRAAVAGTRVFAGTNGRFLFSDDLGASWMPTDIDGAYRTVYDLLLLDATGSEVLLATDTGLFLTADDGASFTPLATTLPVQVYSALAKTADGHLIAGTAAGIVVAASTGGTWQAMGPMTCAVRDLVARANKVAVACADEVITTADLGATWASLPGLGRKPPLSLAVDSNGALLVGTAGYGLFRGPQL